MLNNHEDISKKLKKTYKGKNNTVTSLRDKFTNDTFK